MNEIFDQIAAERKRQDELHPWNNLMIEYRFFTEEYHDGQAERYKDVNDIYERDGMARIDSLLLEELHEVFAETDPMKQREELIQLAALCVKVIEKIDRESKENA
jgi:hypothetical protein